MHYLFQGERLSHAVGCAFAACLERKQKREKECGVTATFDASRTTFTREGSFRVTTATEQAEREEVMRQIQDTKGNGMPVYLFGTWAALWSSGNFLTCYFTSHCLWDYSTLVSSQSPNIVVVVSPASWYHHTERISLMEYFSVSL